MECELARLDYSNGATGPSDKGHQGSDSCNGKQGGSDLPRPKCGTHLKDGCKSHCTRGLSDTQL